jgi:hypothetical protein
MANSFPGSGLAYVDQFAIGRSSGTGLLNTFLSADPNTNQIRVETDNSAVLTYIGISAGIMEYYRGANTSGTLRFQTKVQAASLANGGGAIVFSPNGTASDYTPVERMRILMNGNVGIGTDNPSAIASALTLNMYAASGVRSSFVVESNAGANFAVLGSGLNSGDLGVLYFNLGMRFGYATGKDATGFVETMRLTSDGAVYMSRISSNLTFADSVGGMYVRQNGNGAGNQEELRIFGRNISLVSHTGTRYMDVTSTGNIGINTSSPGTYKLNVNGTFYSAGSSLEYKTDITTLDTDTNKILELRPVTYQYKDEYKHLGKELKSGTQIGLIAEEVAEVFPELALLKQDEDGETRVRNVDYEKLSILLLSEVQKLRKEVNELKNK